MPSPRTRPTPGPSNPGAPNPFTWPSNGGGAAGGAAAGQGLIGTILGMLVTI